MLPERRIADPVTRRVIQIVGWALGVFAFVFATLIIAGGDDRWEGEAFRVAMTLPGAPETWGWLIFACGVAITVGMALDAAHARLAGSHFLRRHRWLLDLPRRAVGAGCTGAGLWCFALGTTFLVQLLDNGYQVGNLGFAVWLLAGFIYLLRAAANLKVLQ